MKLRFSSVRLFIFLSLLMFASGVARPALAATGVLLAISVAGTLVFLGLAFAAGAMLAQTDETSVHLTPENGTIRRQVFKKRDLKAEHEQNLRDTARMAELLAQLKAELERSSERVVSASAAKKAEALEKLIKQIRGRLR